jgi:hypothetical protein
MRETGLDGARREPHFAGVVAVPDAKYVHVLRFPFEKQVKRKVNPGTGGADPPLGR